MVQNIEPNIEAIHVSTKGGRLLAERERPHLTQVAMAKIGGVSKGSQILYEKGKPPSADHLTAIASHGVDILYVLTGVRSPTAAAREILDTRSPTAVARQIVENAGEVERAAFRDAVQATRDYWNDFSPIPRYDVQLAAGDGRAARGPAPMGYLAFNNSWLSHIGVSPDQACLLTVKGDSMTPGLHDGDLVLVDRDRRKIINGRAYAFNDGDRGARIKRLDLIRSDTQPQLVVIRSDNQGSNPPELRTGEEMNRLAEGIIGQVVWSGHVWK